MKHNKKRNFNSSFPLFFTGVWVVLSMVFMSGLPNFIYTNYWHHIYSQSRTTQSTRSYFNTPSCLTSSENRVIHLYILILSTSLLWVMLTFGSPDGCCSTQDSFITSPLWALLLMGEYKGLVFSSTFIYTQRPRTDLSTPGAQIQFPDWKIWSTPKSVLGLSQ